MLWGGKNPHQGLLMIVAREEPGSGQRVLLFLLGFLMLR